MAATDVDEYRKKYQQELNQARPGAAPAAEPAADDLAAQVADLMGAARDRKSPVEQRLSALRALGELEFLGPRFSPFQADYVALLRALAVDPRATVRRAALERLALRKDPEGRDLLIAGLENPADALVPEAVALQFLGHDDHGEIVPLARKVYRRATGAAREEALRILASDPGSESMLKRLLKDKSEVSSIRRVSASGLQNLNPDAFEKAARQIVADDDEFNEIRSTSLAALSRQAPDVHADAKFVEQVASLHARTRSPAMKSSSSRLLDALDTDSGS